MASLFGHTAHLARYPVKSLVGESLESADVDQRGMVGDRLWAVRDGEGKLGSGKNTRRFRRMPGLLNLAAHYGSEPVPTVVFPDGRRIGAGDAAIHDAVSTHLDRPVRLAREEAVSHFDEGPLHLVPTSSLARLGEVYGAAVDVRRVRANLIVDTGRSPAFDENAWTGRVLTIGTDVVVRVREPMVRCVMVELPQVGLDAASRLLATLGSANRTELGLVLDVLEPGTLRLGDPVRPWTHD